MGQVSKNIRHLSLRDTSSADLLFPIPALFRPSQQLRRHLRHPHPHRLDLHATLRATLRAGGFPTPVPATRSAAPEYLVLVQRNSFLDHHALLTDSLLRRLRSYDLHLDIHYFSHSPDHCTPPGAPAPASVPLARLLHRHPSSLSDFPP